MALDGAGRPGPVWILDGLEVTIVGSMSEALRPDRPDGRLAAP